MKPQVMLAILLMNYVVCITYSKGIAGNLAASIICAPCETIRGRARTDIYLGWRNITLNLVCHVRSGKLNNLSDHTWGKNIRGSRNSREVDFGDGRAIHNSIDCFLFKDSRWSRAAKYNIGGIIFKPYVSLYFICSGQTMNNSTA